MMNGLKAIWSASLLAAVSVAPTAAQIHPKPTPAPARLTAPVRVPVLLGGQSFPEVAAFVAKFPEPRRTFFVQAGAEDGDGTEARPWKDLQVALCALEPGDRLRVRAGKYPGAFRIDEPCRDGTAEDPIQVFFDGKATLLARAEASPLTIRRAHWHLVGVYVKLKNSAAAGVVLEGPGAHDLMLDGSRIVDGSGPGLLIGKDASRVTICNSRIAKEGLTKPGEDSVGIQIAAGARDITLADNHLNAIPAGSIRVEAPEPGGNPVRNLVLLANTLRNGGPASIEVGSAEGLRITGNTITDDAGREGTRGLLLESTRDAVVRWNRVSNCAVGIQVGRRDPDDGSVSGAENVTIDHNSFERSAPAGVALDIEAGSEIRFANNTLEGFSTAFLVFGKPPQTQQVRIANNLALGVSGVAFLLADPEAAAFFDFNIFSPAGPANVQVADKTLSLARFLAQGTMPHSRQAAGVHLVGRDLAHISGIETLNKGKALDGIEFQGSAPDIGVAER